MIATQRTGVTVEGEKAGVLRPSGKAATSAEVLSVP